MFVGAGERHRVGRFRRCADLARRQDRLRYVELGVTVNVGSSGGTVGAGQVEVALPYYLEGTGRDAASRARYASHSPVGGLSVSVDEDAGV